MRIHRQNSQGLREELPADLTAGTASLLSFIKSILRSRLFPVSSAHTSTHLVAVL